MNFLKENWDAFANEPSAMALPPKDLEKIRRAFYSGWILLFKTLEMAITDNPEITQEEANSILADVNREINEILVQVALDKLAAIHEKDESCA